MKRLLHEGLMKRLVVFSLVGTLVPLLIVSLISLNYMRIVMKRQAFKQLDSIRDAKSDQVLRFIEHCLLDVRFLAESPETGRACEIVRPHTKDMVKAPDTQGSQKAENAVDHFFKKYMDIHGYTDVYLISAPEGLVLYTAGKRGDFGADLKKETVQDSGLARVFSQVLAKKRADIVDFAQYAPLGSPALFLGAPVLDAGGEIIAVAALQLRPDGIRRIMENDSRIGERGEVYLLDADFKIHSFQSREERFNPRKERIETGVMSDLLTQGEGRKVTRNQRGENVLSSYARIPMDEKLGSGFTWNIIAELPDGEALAPVRQFGILIMLLTIAFALVIGASGYVIARAIAIPLSEATTMLATSIAQISSTVNRLVGITEETTGSVSEITTTVEEVKQTTHLAYEKAEQVAEMAGRVAQTSETGKKATDETSSSMNRIRGEMGAIAESIVNLSEQTQSIEEIINTVNDLADQSNLLSVNASIEAARAGEYGKSFAVVAQEVKSLADQSRKATEQVRNILNDIQKATGDAVMFTDKGSVAVEEGAHLAAQAGDAIQRLAESIVESAQSAMQIAATSKQQLIGTDQLAAAMEIIKEGTIQNLESTKELEGAVRNLDGLVLKLRTLSGGSGNGACRSRGAAK